MSLLVLRLQNFLTVSKSLVKRLKKINDDTKVDSITLRCSLVRNLLVSGPVCIVTSVVYKYNLLSICYMIIKPTFVKSHVM